MNSTMDQNVNTAYMGDTLSLLLRTRNYNEGETISVTIKERDGKDVADGNKELVLTGIVDKEGVVLLKNSVDMGLSEREKEKKEEEKLKREKEEEERRQRRELFSRYNMFEEIK